MGFSPRDGKGFSALPGLLWAALLACAVLGVAYAWARTQATSRAGEVLVEAFDAKSIADMCKMVDFDNLRKAHGAEVATRLRAACAAQASRLEGSASGAQANEDESTCVIGCDMDTLCGMPMTEMCAARTEKWRCDVTHRVLFGSAEGGDAKPVDLPATGTNAAFFQMYRGFCLAIDPSSAKWPLCSCTTDLYRMLARFPIKLTAMFSEGKRSAAVLERWDVLFEPGRAVALDGLVPGLDRPPSARSQAPMPAVYLPVMAMEVSSIFGGTADPKLPFRDTTKALGSSTTGSATSSVGAALSEAMRGTGSKDSRFLAVTLFGAGTRVSLGGTRDYYGAVSPLTDAPLTGVTSVYVAVLIDVASKTVVETREILTFENGTTRFGFRLARRSFEVVPAAVVADSAWLGYKDHEFIEA